MQHTTLYGLDQGLLGLGSGAPFGGSESNASYSMFNASTSVIHTLHPAGHRDNQDRSASYTFNFPWSLGIYIHISNEYDIYAVSHYNMYLNVQKLKNRMKQGT